MQRTLDRLRGEFLEMPGLCLTVEQAQRLCGVDSTICQPILDALVDAGFLQRSADGRYARPPDHDGGRPGSEPSARRLRRPTVD